MTMSLPFKHLTTSPFNKFVTLTLGGFLMTGLMLNLSGQWMVNAVYGIGMVMLLRWAVGYIGHSTQETLKTQVKEKALQGWFARLEKMLQSPNPQIRQAVWVQPEPEEDDGMPEKPDYVYYHPKKANPWASKISTPAGGDTLNPDSLLDDPRSMPPSSVQTRNISLDSYQNS